MTKRIFKTMFPLFLGMSMLFIGNGLVVSAGSVQMHNLGASEIIIGIISACFYIGAMTSTIVSHKIVSKVGHIRSFAIFTVIFATCGIFHILSANLYFWAILRMGLGFCYYALLMLIESWLNQKVANSIRSRVLAIYECVFYISFGLGIWIMSFNLSNIKIFIISATFIMLSSIPLNLVRIKEPQIPEKEALSVPKIFSIAPLALVTSIIAGILVNGFYSMASLFIIYQGNNINDASYFMMIAMIGGFSCQILLGNLSDKFGRKIAIILASIISLIASLLFCLLPYKLWIWDILAFFLGSGIFCLYALSLARANDMLLHKSQSVKIGRTLLFSYSIGSLLSAIVMGFSIKLFGNFGFIYVYIFLLSVLILFSLAQKSIPKKSRTHYDPHIIRTVAIDESEK